MTVQTNNDKPTSPQIRGVCTVTADSPTFLWALGIFATQSNHTSSDMSKQLQMLQDSKAMASVCRPSQAPPYVLRNIQTFTSKNLGHPKLHYRKRRELWLQTPDAYNLSPTGVGARPIV